jgi:hypothetical protein
VHVRVLPPQRIDRRQRLAIAAGRRRKSLSSIGEQFVGQRERRALAGQAGIAADRQQHEGLGVEIAPAVARRAVACDGENPAVGDG